MERVHALCGCIPDLVMQAAGDVSHVLLSDVAQAAEKSEKVRAEIHDALADAAVRDRFYEFATLTDVWTTTSSLMASRIYRP